MKQPKKAIVIGAGIGGIASAIRLAVQGFEVEVLEKNSYPGGKLHAFSVDGYHFDAGPSLFTQPHNIEELFALANEPMELYLQYKQQTTTCKYFYEDGIVLNANANPKLFAQELAQKLGENAHAVETYLRQSKKVYRNIGSIFLNFSLHKLSTLFKANILKALATVRFKHLFGSLHQLNARHFTKPHTIQLFNRYATYNGSNPYKAPGILSLIPHLEFNEGVFYPTGGMISITQALYKLAVKKGVRFHFNHPVQQIIQRKKTIASVVVLGEHIPANVVVSNVDAYFTYKNLLSNDNKAQKILQQERSSSALIFYWGINTSFPQLQLHNIFFSSNYEAEFEHLFVHKTLFSDPTVYVNITSKCEPGIQAPAGKENWFVMVNAPANTNQDWSIIQQQAKHAIIAKLNRILKTDITPLIVVEQVLNPVSIQQQTNSYMGSLYGTSSNSKMAAFLRHPNFTNAIKGLYFVGGSVHPGGGIPLCLKSAKIMANIVANDFNSIS